MPLKALSGLTRLPLVEDSRGWVRVLSNALLTVICAAAGIGAVVVLEPVLSRQYMFPALVAVILASIVAGARWGVLTSALFCGAYAYFFLEPRSSLAVNDPREGVDLIIFFVAACVVAAVCGALRLAYAQLREQHRILTQIHHQREDLLRALTHDVRSPLSVISMNAAMMGRTDLDDRRRAEVIQSSIKKIDSMLKDLVELVALESGALALERVTIELPAMLTRLKDGLAGTLPIERVKVAIASNLPGLHVDPQRFDRVLVNLLSNALKYSSGDVTVRASQQERNIIVSVSDAGAGIAAADLPHIFEKYYRASGAESQEGLGLGLYITRLLVEAHGGRIWAESSPDRGTTFNVALPLDVPPPRPPPPSEWAPTPPPRALVPPSSGSPTGTQY